MRTPEILNAHEEGLIRSFILPSKRQRLLQKLGSQKRRSEMLDGFNHRADYLDERYAQAIAPRDQNEEWIYSRLKKKGAPAVCHVMGDSALDGRDLPLREAIESVMDNGFAHFISCVPGKLGFFQDEVPGPRFILERK